jgi:hypothetical protein
MPSLNGEQTRQVTLASPSFGLFRCGLDYLTNAVMKNFYQPNLFKKCLDKIKGIENIHVLGLYAEMCR